VTDIVECTHCGWHHFAVTRAYAEAEVSKFNEYFDTLTFTEKQMFGGQPSSLKSYTHCDRCGNPASMKPATKTLTGQTIGPIIWELNDE
jgi:hypothetical protein